MIRLSNLILEIIRLCPICQLVRTKMYHIKLQFFEILAWFVQYCSYNDLKRISVVANKEKNERYHCFHEKRIEIEKGLSDEEFLRFMEVVTDPRDRLCFLLISTLGLRPNELERLRVEDGRVYVPDSKGGYAANLPLPGWLLAEYKKHSILPLRTLRAHFIEYRRKAGLDEVYMRTLPCGRQGIENRRYRFTLYSLRHYSVTRFYNQTKDIDLTRRFARHRHSETTQVYLKASRKDDLEQAIHGLSKLQPSLVSLTCTPG